MISGRTLAQGVGCESKMSQEYFQAASTCSLSESDYKELKQTEGKNILVRNRFGEIVLSSRIDSGLPQGLIFIPYGPWANVLTGSDTGGCGRPQFKGSKLKWNIQTQMSRTYDRFSMISWIR